MKYRKALIVGFTKRTSLALAKALLEMGVEIAVSDTSAAEDKKQLLAGLSQSGLVVDYLGRQDAGVLDEFRPNIVLPSPGVPLGIPLIAEAVKRGIEVAGDIELFWRLYSQATYIGITGTDGKTTTTTLVYEIVRRERNALVGGNIGTPLFEHYGKIGSDTVIVLELSSFQLEGVSQFRPRTAAVLNVAADHLDRYPSIEAYRDAKKRIFMNQTADDTAVLNRDCPNYGTVSAGLKSRIVTFSRKDPSADCYFDGTTVFLDGKPFVERSSIKLRGVHNVENAMAAILMAKSVGVSDGTIRETLAEFAGLHHRLEFVRAVNGIEFYNDSKATTVNAMEKALESFENPVLLIAGGRDKGLDFTAIKSLVEKKARALILIGEASDKIDAALAHPNTVRAATMRDAAKLALENAKPGDAVILSPGCTSYDWYNNYEERGDDFKKAVNEL